MFYNMRNTYVLTTLKLRGGVFAMLVFPIRKQITMSIYFPLHFNLVGDLFFCYHTYCILIELIN